jgi:hypothetical protein
MTELSEIEKCFDNLIDHISRNWHTFDSYGLNYMCGIHHAVASSGNFEAGQEVYFLFNIYYERLQDE